jgi:phosphohistidine phosphatase SixA
MLHTRPPLIAHHAPVCRLRQYRQVTSEVTTEPMAAVSTMSRGVFLWGNTAALLAAATLDRDVFSSMQTGGYVLYFRHGPTDFSQIDTTTDYNDCSKQRNLTDAGRTLERRVGAAIRKLSIPIGGVFADPFCRTRESAQLLFGRYSVLRQLMPGATSLSDNLRRVLATLPEGRVNTAMVLHHDELVAIDGPSLAEGEAAVFKPDGSRFQLIAQITPDSWLSAAAVSESHSIRATASR